MCIVNNYNKNIGMMKMASIKKYIKYAVFGGFIGLLLVYLHFKKVSIK